MSTLYYSRSANTRGIRNNNPFNIRKSKSHWLGELCLNSDPDFVIFRNMDFGVRAGVKLLSNYIRKFKDSVTGVRINTISRIILRFAPNSENDSERYIDFVVNSLSTSLHRKFSRDTVITYPSCEFAHLCMAIMIYESQYFVPSEHIYYIINHFKLY